MFSLLQALPVLAHTERTVALCFSHDVKKLWNFLPFRNKCRNFALSCGVSCAFANDIGSQPLRPRERSTLSSATTKSPNSSRRMNDEATPPVCFVCLRLPRRCARAYTAWGELFSVHFCDGVWRYLWLDVLASPYAFLLSDIISFQGDVWGRNRTDLFIHTFQPTGTGSTSASPQCAHCKHLHHSNRETQVMNLLKRKRP